jgi:hypothetical protein
MKSVIAAFDPQQSYTSEAFRSAPRRSTPHFARRRFLF